MGGQERGEGSARGEAVHHREKIKRGDGAREGRGD